MIHIKTVTPAIPIRAMAIDNDRTYCLLGARNSELYIVDMKRDKIVKQHLSGGACTAACFDDTGECFTVGSDLGHVYMYTLSDETNETKDDTNALQ